MDYLNIWHSTLTILKHDASSFYPITATGAGQVAIPSEWWLRPEGFRRFKFILVQPTGLLCMIAMILDNRMMTIWFCTLLTNPSTVVHMGDIIDVCNFRKTSLCVLLLTLLNERSG